MGRKRSEAVEEKRKPVKVRLIDRKHAGKVVEVYRLLEELVADHHADTVDGVLRNLDQAKIALAWREGWKPDVDGVVKLAQIRKATDAEKYLFGGEWDYVIELNAEAWPRLSADRQRQVMDHELYHAAPDLDRHGKQKINAREALCWRMRKHYFQEHREIVERYGAEACFGLNDAAKKAVEEADRPLLAAIEQSGHKADGKPSDWRKAGLEALQLHSKKITDAHLEKLRDAGMPNLGELARRMDDEPGVWARGLRFADAPRILAGMGIKLCDLTISELRDLLLANERAIGPHAASTQIIRRELERKSPPGRKPLRLSRSEDGREDRP